MTLQSELPGLEAELRAIGAPDRAEAMAAYMKEKFVFLGVKTPERRAAVTRTISTRITPEREDLVAAVDRLWQFPEREFQYCGTDLLRRWHRVLGLDDLAWLGTLVTTKPWWDTVDALATHPVGQVVLRHRDDARETVDAWATGDDMWLHRTAILHQLLYKDDTDIDQLLGYCDLHAASTEFFHRKAIGWALRQLARTDPDTVRRYVDERRDQLSGLTVREALKHL